MDKFKSPVSLRGDHYWCPLSLQVDAYWQCVGCPMCYLRRMNRTWGMAQKVASPETIRKELENGLKNPTPKTPLGRAINAKKTIRFGNKADPYQPIEKVTGVSRQILSVFNALDWSYVVQTKFPSLLAGRDLDMLKDSSGLATVMIELSPGLEWDWEHLEGKLTDPPKVRLDAAAELMRAGVRVAFNGEPFVPGLHTTAQFRDALQAVKSVGVRTYNTYFMHINDYNLKAMYAAGVDIEAVWRGTQDGTWGPIHRELIEIAKAEGVTLGCPDFLTSREYIQPTNTCCGMSVPNPSTFTVMEWKRLWLAGVRDIDDIIARTWDGVGDLDEARAILSGQRPEVFSITDLEKELNGANCPKLKRGKLL